MAARLDHDLEPYYALIPSGRQIIQGPQKPRPFVQTSSLGKLGSESRPRPPSLRVWSSDAVFRDSDGPNHMPSANYRGRQDWTCRQSDNETYILSREAPENTYDLSYQKLSPPSHAPYRQGRLVTPPGLHSPSGNTDSPRSFHSQLPPHSPLSSASSYSSYSPRTPYSSVSNSPYLAPSAPLSPFRGNFNDTLPHAAPASLPAVKETPKPQVQNILTPSGRAFAIGRKIQNISTDPLAPCVMYWPENEPLPEQCQIRPTLPSGVTQPPILNTGNRGPIEHQPGDWICGKCKYLNWRRRKVCQTCYPYAEGNGGAVSATVIAERVALLKSTLDAPGGQAIAKALPQTSYLGSRSPLYQMRHRCQSSIELDQHKSPQEPVRAPTRASTYHQPTMTRDAHYNNVMDQASFLLPSFMHSMISSPKPVPSPAPIGRPAYNYKSNLAPSLLSPSAKADRRCSTGSMANASNIWRFDYQEKDAYTPSTYSSSQESSSSPVTSESIAKDIDARKEEMLANL